MEHLQDFAFFPLPCQNQVVAPAPILIPIISKFTFSTASQVFTSEKSRMWLKCVRRSTNENLEERRFSTEFTAPTFEKSVWSIVTHKSAKCAGLSSYCSTQIHFKNQLRDLSAHLREVENVVDKAQERGPAGLARVDVV